MTGIKFNYEELIFNEMTACDNLKKIILTDNNFIVEVKIITIKLNQICYPYSICYVIVITWA